MKPSGIILGFVPLIVYGILAGTGIVSVTIALLAAIVTTLVFCYGDLKSGRIIAWASLLLFSGLLAAGALAGQAAIMTYDGVLIYGTLATVTIGSILAGTPFTIQYARAMVAPEFQETQKFFRVNLLMTAAWGIVFVVNLLLACLALAVPMQPGYLISLLTYLFLAAGIVFTIRYPVHLMKRMPQAPAGH